MLRRAGLDYWDLLDVRIHESLDAFLCKHDKESLWLVETGGGLRYDEAHFPEGAFFVFGQETKGLPQALVDKCRNRVVRIPMRPDPKARSLNLSNTVALVLFEAFRQNDFPGLA